MSDKLIFVPFAYDSRKETGANIQKKNKALEIYCKNFCVALVSLKRENPDCDVALITDLNLSEKYKDILTRNNILIINQEYNEFLFPDEFPWSLDFYKLCALKAALNLYNYKYYCYMDADIIANGSLDAVFKECEEKIFLNDINHGLNVLDYRNFLERANKFLNTEHMRFMTHYGGEFFAANRGNALFFVLECEEIYKEIIEKKFQFTSGDELIISLVADRFPGKFKNAGAYIYRFWTGSFRLVSTCYKYNPVVLLHLPAEKEYGMLKIFNRYIAKNKFPKKKTIYRVCHLSTKNKPVILKRIVKNILSAVNIKVRG